jgi:hypothetical protein
MISSGENAPRPARASRVLAGLLCLVAAAGCASPHKPVLTHKQEPEWPRVTIAKIPEDIAQARSDYGDRQDFSTLCEHERPLRDALEALNDENWLGGLQLAEPWLQRCPVDIDERYIAATALTKLGRFDEAHEQVRWFQGLVDSVLSSGDGQGPETAYDVISLGEEYAILRVLGLKSEDQQTLEGGIDALKVRSVRGRGPAAWIYFNPAAHWRRLEREAANDVAAPPS